MAGQTIPLISKRVFNFASGSGVYTAVKAVPVVAYTEGTLLVRVHAATFSATSAISVVAKSTAPSSEEPNTDFVNATTLATATINSTITAGSLVKTSLAANFGAFVEISVVGALASGSCTATVSADLVVKE